MTADIIAPLAMGLLGSLHCVGMCGGISAALAQGIEARGLNAWRLQVLFGFGRMASYAIAGALAGALGHEVRDTLGGTGGQLLRILAGAMIVLLGFYVAGWWKVLTRLEQWARPLWRRVSPLARHFLPVHRAHQALALGVLWGWLPCGLVYSALTFALTAASPRDGAIAMAYFGLGTLPAMTVTGMLAGHLRRWLQSFALRRVAGALLIALGMWSLHQVATHAHAEGHHPAHAHAMTVVTDVSPRTMMGT